MSEKPLGIPEEWELGEDGVPTRHAARVIIISQDGYTLLMQGHDSYNPNYKWWFTVGGGLEEGETLIAAAQREVYEETGYKVSESQLKGPVIERDALFKFTDRDRRQIEHIFLLQTKRFTVDNSRWTQLEQNVIDRLEWVPISSLKELGKKTNVFPPQLIEVISALHDNGWDGICVKIDEYNKNGA